MKLELVAGMAPRAWDEAIEGFDTKCLFHQSSWLDFIEETQGAARLRFRITENGRTRGYFVGLTVKKGPLRVLGSPLPGWTTDYMGPVVDEGFDFEKFLDALERARRLLKIHHIELCSPCLPVELMRSRGYEVHEKTTYVVPLSGDKEKMWKNLRSKARQNVRAGLKNNLVVEAASDPPVVDEYYAQLIDVYARQKLVPSYPPERVRSLFRVLHPGSILALRVRHGDRVIATGLFPYDGRCAYMFGAASYRRFHGLYPNELLYWTAMTVFAQKGVPLLDMCGDGSFKPKFGARKVAVHRYVKSFNMAARVGREAYRRFFDVKQVMFGRLSKLGLLPDFRVSGPPGRKSEGKSPLGIFESPEIF